MQQKVGIPISEPLIFTLTEDVKKGSLIRLKTNTFDNLFRLEACSVAVNGEKIEEYAFKMDPADLKGTETWAFYRATLPIAEFYAPYDIAKGSQITAEIQYIQGSGMNITAGQKWNYRLLTVSDHEDRGGEVCSDTLEIEFIAYEPVKMEAYLKCDGRLQIQYFDKYFNPTENTSKKFYITYGDNKSLTVDAIQSANSNVVQLPVDGLTRVTVRDDNGMEAVSNYLPVIFGKNVYFSDFHWHCEFSDGQRPLEDVMYSARYQLGLDFCGTGDHGGFNGRFSYGHTVDEMKEIYKNIEEDGIFATIAGSEINARQGHVNANAKSADKYNEFVNSDPDMYSIIANNPYRYPLKEYNDFIHDDEVMLVPHHTNTDSAVCGGFVNNDGLPSWGAMPWPNNGAAYEHVRLIEIVQTSGSYETEYKQPDWKMSERSGGTLGGSARTALTKGFKVGFCGCSDAHNGWPTGRVGNPFCTGLTGVLADELTTPAIFDSLYQRCCYATSGARIIGAARMDGILMGNDVYQAPGQKRTIEIELHGTAPIECVEIIHSGITLASLEVDGSADFYGVWEDTRAGRALSEAWYYVRARQTDGECVWLSPFFIGLK